MNKIEIHKSAIKVLLTMNEEQLDSIDRIGIHYHRELAEWYASELDNQVTNCGVLVEFPEFYASGSYRKAEPKPETRWVNQHEVEAPLVEITERADVFLVMLDGIATYPFAPSFSNCREYLESGLLFKTEQGALDNYNAIMDFDTTPR